MKLLFIYPSNDPSYPLQLGSLSAYLKSKGHEIRLLTLIIRGEIGEKQYIIINKEINDFKPQFIALSGYEMSFPWIKKITAYIKKNWPKIKTIVGGYYPTLVPEEVIAFPFIDIICLGEGEKPLTELLSSKKINYKIKNLWFKKGKQIIKNAVRPLIENLDDLPFPDREMLNYQEHLNLEKRGERNVKVMASRGCPYQCTYCSNRYLRSVYPNKNKYLRMRSTGNVIKELKYLKSNYSFEKVGFHDDNLTLDVGWLKSFAESYKKEIGLPFYCATRVESCTEEVLDILKVAGCELLLIGVESGDEKYRGQIMKRFMTNREIVNAFKKARVRGLLTWSFTMVGLPFETRRMILKTLWLNLKCRPDFTMASIFYPLKGTELGNVCYQKGWVELKLREKVSSYAWESILNYPNLTRLEIKFAKYLNSLTAIRSKFFWKILNERISNLLKNI